MTPAMIIIGGGNGSRKGMKHAHCAFILGSSHIFMLESGSPKVNKNVNPKSTINVYWNAPGTYSYCYFLRVIVEGTML